MLIHPLQHLSSHWSLYDKFRQGNTKQKEEYLRRTELIKELDFAYTETAEQLKSDMSKDTYFLDVMNPVHFIQMISMILAVRNHLKMKEYVRI